ncbi:MAG: hypothetical protein ACK42I_10030, partial [Thermomicrobium sp.]
QVEHGPRRQLQNALGIARQAMRGGVKRLHAPMVTRSGSVQRPDGLPCRASYPAIPTWRFLVPQGLDDQCQRWRIQGDPKDAWASRATMEDW